jgi:hypothetical protein
MDEAAHRRLRIAALIALAALAVAGALLAPPIAQDPAYHGFADQRLLYGIASFWNVTTNAPFLISGVWGLALLARHHDPGVLPGLRPAYAAFFTGVLLTALGSAYYHLDPSNTTLFWDRLPMTLAFMAFFAMIVGEYLSPAAGRRLLWPLLAAGILAILYWHYTESRGRGDLRAYALVQFLPMLLVPLIMLLFRSRLTGTGYLWAMLAAYLVAKLLEYLDADLYIRLGISGHALKHLAAALGTLFVCIAVRRRRPVGAAQDAQHLRGVREAGSMPDA